MGLNRISLALVLAVFVCIVSVSCFGNREDWDWRGPGDWFGNAEGTAAASANIQAYSAGHNDGDVRLSLICSGKWGLAAFVSWDGNEVLIGNVAVELTGGASLEVNSLWYNSDQTVKAVGTVDFDEAAEVVAILFTIDKFDGENLSVTLRSQTGVVEAEFGVGGFIEAYSRMEEYCLR